MTSSPPALALLGISAALFVASLFLPAIVGPTFRHSGLGCLAGGWAMLLGLVSRPAWFVSWLANPLYLATLALWRRAAGSVAFTGLTLAALVCALAALAIHDFPPNEASEEAPVTLGPSTYVWIAAIAVSLVAALVSLLSRRDV